MDSLNTIPSSGSFGDVSAKLNDNFSKVGQSLTTLENVAIANKGYFDTLASLQAAFPSPKAGNIAYVANVASSTGYYIYNVVSGVWTATSTEAPAVGVEISNYAQHGYSSSPKTLKQVDDEVVQLAGKNDLFDKINIDITTGISAIAVLGGAYAEENILVIPVGVTGNSSYQSTRILQDFLDTHDGENVILRCSFNVNNYIPGSLNSYIKNANTWGTLSTGIVKHIIDNTYLVDFNITIDKTINHQVLIQKMETDLLTSELRIFPLSVFLLDLSVEGQANNTKIIAEKKINELVQPQIDVLNNYIDVKEQITKGVNVVGGPGYTLGERFICTNIGYEHNEDYLLESVQVNTTGSGTLHLAVGYIDQRGLAILLQEFTVDVIQYYNDIDVKSKGIVIPAGSYLFAYSKYGGSGDTLETFWNAYTSPDTHQFYFGTPGEIMGQPSLSTYPNGTYLQLGWKGVILETVFPLKSELKQVEIESQQALEVANNASARINVVYDRSGNAFDLLVFNGSLQIITKQYSKVLVLSNSTAANGRVYAYGWCGIRGMASSIISNDYVHKLETGLKTKNPNAEVVICNLWEWEANYRSLHSLSYYLDASLAENPDCIVVRLGENVQNATQLQSELELLINYILDYLANLSTPIYPALYITSMAMSDGVAQNNALIAASNTFHCPYVNVSVSGQEYKERVGNYLWGDQTLDGGATWNTDVQVLYKIASAIVSHPNDVGMLRIANQILTAMNYDTINAVHSVTVNNSSLAIPSYFSNWVTGGRFNLQVNDKTLVTSVTAIDEDNNSISVMNHNDGVFSFDMPDSNVIITIN